jgi:hypothetical protein
LPTLNEAANVEPLLEKVVAALSGSPANASDGGDMFAIARKNQAA